MVGADVRDVERQRHRCIGQIDGLHRGLEVEQSVPPRELEQPFTQLAEHYMLLREIVLLHKTRNTGQVDFEVNLLIPVILQVVQQGRQILDSAMPIELRHAEDGLRQHRMQFRIQREEVAPIGDKRLQVLWLREVKTAAEAGQDHAQAEDVCQRIMMAHLVFPSDITWQIHRS